MMIDVRPRSSVSKARSISDLGRPVDVRGRLVEDQDARVGDERARDRDQLALARREPGAALADDVVEPVLEPRRDAVDADRARGRLDLLVGRVGPPEADVVGDRPAEEERILQHDAELAPVRAEPHVAKVDAVDAHGALRRGRRSARRASRSSTCRRPTRRRARCSRPPGSSSSRPWIDRLLAVGEHDPVELEPPVDPRAARARPAGR